MELLIGSGNCGKMTEIGEALAGLPITIITPKDMGINETLHEEGETLKDNALQKARFFFERSGGMPTLADDSGIFVEALKDELGIHTRRWGAGPDVSDHHWIAFFLERMRREKNRRARFVCTLCFIHKNGVEQFFEGQCDGVIIDELEASYLPGLPISACFKPDGYDRVFSALTIEQKNAVSHRGKALQAFKNSLRFRSQIPNPQSL